MSSYCSYGLSTESCARSVRAIIQPTRQTQATDTLQSNGRLMFHASLGSSIQNRASGAGPSTSEPMYPFTAATCICSHWPCPAHRWPHSRLARDADQLCTTRAIWPLSNNCVASLTRRPPLPLNSHKSHLYEHVVRIRTPEVIVAASPVYGGGQQQLHYL